MNTTTRRVEFICILLKIFEILILLLAITASFSCETCEVLEMRKR